MKKNFPNKKVSKMEFLQKKNFNKKKFCEKKFSENNLCH